MSPRRNLDTPRLWRLSDHRNAPTERWIRQHFTRTGDALLAEARRLTTPTASC